MEDGRERTLLTYFIMIRTILSLMVIVQHSPELTAL